MSDPVEVAAEAVHAEKERRDMMPYEEIIKDDTPWAEAIARAAILAFLKACEGEAGVSAGMKATLKAWKSAGVHCEPDLEGSEIAARAVLRALADIAGGGT